MAPPTRFKIVHKLGGGGEEYAIVHQTGCRVDSGDVRWIDAHEAYAALADGVPACTYCRPGAELGLDVD